jgi:tRNA(adenine34) deaminase
MTDELFMREALAQAQLAYAIDEVPIGCIIVQHDGNNDGSGDNNDSGGSNSGNRGGKIIARAFNERNSRKNALFHAEITAISTACEKVGDWRLENCTLYVTIEPCPMCAGAIIQARVGAVVYGAKNPKAGCAGSILDILNEPRFNHRPRVVSGVLADECSALMSKFFADKR